MAASAVIVVLKVSTRGDWMQRAMPSDVDSEGSENNNYKGKKTLNYAPPYDLAYRMH